MPTFKPEILRTLLKQDFWSKPELEWILFGPEHPSLQEPETSPNEPDIELKSQLHRNIEKVLDQIKQYIDDAVSIDKLKKSPEKIQRRLYLNMPPISVPINHQGYETLGVLKLLNDKEYPISKELIRAIKDSDWDTAFSKAKNLPNDMMEVIGSDCVLTETIKIIPAPPGTEWKDVTIILTAHDSVKISIKGQTRRFHFSQIGFLDERKGDCPNMLWTVLTSLIKEQGELQPKGGLYQRNLVSTASRLNLHMKKIFGIDQNIFPPYKTKKSYKAAFKVLDRTFDS